MSKNDQVFPPIHSRILFTRKKAYRPMLLYYGGGVNGHIYFASVLTPTDQNSRTGSEQMRNIYVLAKFWSNFSPLKSQVPGATTLPNAQCRLTRACKTRAATWLPRAATWLPRDATWLPRDATWLPRDATWLPRLPASGCVRRATCAWVLACFLLLAAAACGRHRHYHTGRRCTRSVT
jgi:hypothetical protein